MTMESGAQFLPLGPWKKNFTIDGVAGGPIQLRQVGGKSFVLESEIQYGGETGLEGKGLDEPTMDDIRKLPAGINTDLASVPGPMRWFLGTYGAHTPAVLIHDRLIPTPDHLTGKMTDQYADRYLRFMAKDVGMRWLRRWVMWAGVALRTRWAGGGLRKASVVLWIIAAIAGITYFVNGAMDGDVGQMLLASLGVFVFAGLWDRQYGAGIIGGITAPWLLPPAILAVVGLAIYAVFEFVLGSVWAKLGHSEVSGSGSYGADGI
jgi:hypothetical protein